MPEMSCLFAVAAPAILDALRGDPDLRDRVHHFHACAGLILRPPGLAVAFLSGAIAPPWPESFERWSAPAPDGIPALPPHETAGCLQQALPPPEVLLRWTAISRATHQRLAWWWWWERGDDLYADAAWLFDPRGAPAILTRVTPLASDAPDDQGWIHREGRAPEALSRAPLQLAMEHLGFRSELQYFVPTDSWHFDWERYRV